MTDVRAPLGDRTDADITVDVVACLRQIHPSWIDAFPDDRYLTLEVQETLDELKGYARQNLHEGRGYSSTGCMTVTYDAEDDSYEWSVIVGYRYPENTDNDDD